MFHYAITSGRGLDREALAAFEASATLAERNGDFSQSVLNGQVRSIYNPFSSVLSKPTPRCRHETTSRAFGPESWERAMGAVSGPLFKFGESEKATSTLPTGG